MTKIKRVAVLFLLVFTINNSQGQISNLPDIGFDFLTGYINDSKLILQEYIRPYMNILGTNLNGGWYSTAEPHKTLGFDLSFSTSLALAPTADLTYDLNDLNFQKITYDNTNSVVPTIAGSGSNLPDLVISETVDLAGNTQTVELARVTHPNGIGVTLLPLPMAQLSVGLIKGTNLSIRYVPTINIADAAHVGLFGIGGMHSVSQWIPVVKSMKFLNISVQGGYTKLSTDANINLQPNVEVEPANPPAFDDQQLTLGISAWTLNLIASQSIPIITVYEGIGIASSTGDMALLGTYPITTVVTEAGPDLGKTTYEAVTDPVPSMLFENNNKLRLNVGLRLKLGFFTINYDLTKSLYTTHTAGIGITFR